MARSFDLVVRGGTVVTPMRSEVTDVAIDGERIAAIGVDLRGSREIDARGRLVFPGVIDAHTHMALPVAGTRSSDDFGSGTIAAACGGVTTIIDFTVGSSETSIPDDLEARLETARPSVIDYAFHGEVIGWRPGREWEFRDAIGLGLSSFKFFTAYEASGRRTPPDQMETAFGALAEWGAVALVHCEEESLISSVVERLTPEEIGHMGTLADARPDLCERSAIVQVARIARATGCATHIVHVSSLLGLEAVREGRTAGARLTAETCPQYLTLTREAYDRPDGHLFSASPSLRTDDDRRALWDGLRHRGLDFVATDHCPFTRAQKTWRGAVNDIPRLLSEGPARTFGLYPKKGAIEVGSDADLVIFDPQSRWRIEADRLHMNVDFSPYEGIEVAGRVSATLARGTVLYSEGRITTESGRGVFLPRML